MPVNTHIRFQFVIILSLLSVTVRAENMAQPVSSQPVSLGSGNYTLHATNGRELSLQYQLNKKKAAWIVMTESIKKAEAKLWPSDDNDYKIEQIVLARWSKPSLLAVVKASNGKQSVFWAMGFAQVAKLDTEQDHLNSRAVVITKGEHKDQILAVSADINPPAFTIVTGKLARDGFGRIASGTIAIDWCGFLESAEVGRFIPVYPKRDIPGITD